MNIVLANVDLKAHMTDEGEQLQRGLAACGWTLCGTGYGDGCSDVKILLERFYPKAVFVQQKSDWDPASGGAFRKDLGFQNLGDLKQHADILKICPVKDASGPDYQRRFCEEIGANLVVHYYHRKSIGALCPWLDQTERIEFSHSIDFETAQRSFKAEALRGRGIVSGAVSGVYPLRSLIFKHTDALGIHKLTHAGYDNKGSASTHYLQTIGSYKVSVATASQYGFALRKIIEAVAVGATPITNLPEYDVLPYIDEALFRIDSDSSVLNIQVRIDFAETMWNENDRKRWARACWNFYDWRSAGFRLNQKIQSMLEYGE